MREISCCHERGFMLSLDKNSQADVITAFNNTSRYLDDFLNLDNPVFDNLISSIYPKELKLNKANNIDTFADILIQICPQIMVKYLRQKGWFKC